MTSYAIPALLKKRMELARGIVNIRNKVARGMFTAVFLLQCLQAIGVREIRLE